MASRLDHLARRVEGDPFFLGSALADYARSEHLDEQGLAATLRCSPETLTRLKLCRRPYPEPERFRADLAAIVARFPADPAVLAEAVRRSDALARLRGSSMGPGALIAARDREEDRAAPPPEEAP